MSLDGRFFRHRPRARPHVEHASFRLRRQLSSQIGVACDQMRCMRVLQYVWVPLLNRQTGDLGNRREHTKELNPAELPSLRSFFRICSPHLTTNLRFFPVSSQVDRFSEINSGPCWAMISRLRY